MSLKQTHTVYRKTSPIATALRRVLAAALWVFPAAVAYLPPVMAGELAPSRIVRQVLNAKSFVLEGDETVRLAAIQAPNVVETDGQKRPGEPMGEEARAFLAALIQGKEVRLEALPEPHDRHGRLVAQVFLADGRWVQGELLKAGMAMVYPFADSGPLLGDMLTLERTARQEKKGIWALPYYALIDQAEAGRHADRFKLVEGTVRDVAEARGNLYLNFGENWKTDFTAFIAKDDAKYFKGVDLKALAGKRVRVRGWLYLRNGPALDLTAPGQVELIE